MKILQFRKKSNQENIKLSTKWKEKTFFLRIRRNFKFGFMYSEQMKISKFKNVEINASISRNL